MGERWVIHQGSETLGPWTAAEVRQSLRDGRVNPFDLVALEGSQVKHELIGVDAIFAEAEAADVGEEPPFDAEADALSEEATSLSPQGHDEDLSDFDDALPATKPSAVSSDDSPQGVLRELAPGQGKKRRSSKMFYLRDKKQRELGPLSAKEIQSLYYRGILDRSVKVLRRPGTKGVIISRFVAEYGGAKAADFRSNYHRIDLGTVANSSAGLPSSRVMEELSLIHRHRHIFGTRGFSWLLLLAIVIGVTLAFGWIRLRSEYQGGHWRAPMLAWLGMTQEEPPLSVEPPSPTTRPLPKASEKLSKVPRKAVTKEAKVPKRPRVKRTLPKGQGKPSRAAVYRRQAAKTSVSSPKPRPQLKKKKSAGGRGVLGLANQVGKVVTIGPLGFDMAQVDACEASCQVTFRDQRGLVVHGRFFKSAYEGTLKRSRGRATIRGLVAKQSEGYVIYLQSVR